jgi:hypothetical protein
VGIFSLSFLLLLGASQPMSAWAFVLLHSPFFSWYCTAFFVEKIATPLDPLPNLKRVIVVNATRFTGRGVVPPYNFFS